ncbi:calcium release-activated calcium channel protein 1-like [Planococcus citri]|uniref:calcium release-activated calcium channel protein 1-like n=1 Tax=Planococcus citri TaxID=170843 RepID=UPI0031FA4478
MEPASWNNNSSSINNINNNHNSDNHHYICNSQFCKNNYYGSGDIRWKRDQRPGAGSNSGAFFPNCNNYRRWNAMAAAAASLPITEFARPPYEMPPPSARRKYLQRSLTSSEILAPTYKYVPSIPSAKLMKNSFCTNSNKSIHGNGSAAAGNGYDTHTLPSAYHTKRDNGHRLIVNQIADKDGFSESTSNVNANANQAQPCSIYSSESETSIGPKVSSTISTLPMGSPKHSDDSSGLKPSFESQFSLMARSQCCQNCHIFNSSNRKGTGGDEWQSQSTVGEGHFTTADESNDGGLSWRRLHMSRAKLKATATTSELLSGFAMVAMVELQINEPTNVPEWLFIMFSVCTTVLVAVHIFALMISTYLLPNIDAVSKLQSAKLVTESPHERMRGFVELAWAFSTVLGLFLFLVEVAILCWVKFWDFSFRAAMAATIIVIPVLILFIIFVFHFYRTLVVHKCKSTTLDINELEEMRKKLDHASSAA